MADLADPERSFVPTFIGDQTSTTSIEAPRAGVVQRWQDPATSVQNARFRAKKKRQKGTNVSTHGGPGHLTEVGQHSLKHSYPLAASLTTGNDLSFDGRGGDLSVRGSGGKLTHAIAASGVFDFTASDAANAQLDTTNDQGKFFFHFFHFKLSTLEKITPQRSSS